MTLSKKILSVLIAVVSVFTMLNVGIVSASAATTAGAISSAANVSAGVSIKWTKSSGKTGYYIYRKYNSSSKWTKIKTIKGASTTSWVDTNATAGKMYNYKVYSYKGSKAYTNSKTKTVYRLKTPSISSISLSGDNVRLVSTNDSIAGGYVIKYSKNSDFSNATELVVYGTKADKIICNLSCSTTYYFKVRAFKTIKDVRYYSGYSSKKSFKTKGTYTRYTTKYETYVYSKATSSSTKTVLPYNSKVTMYQDVSVTSTGTWKKIKYDGAYYYIWLTPDSNKLTSKKNTYDFISENNTDLQNKIIKTAVDIFLNWETEYDYSRDYSNGEINPNTNKHPFDCSGLVRYVYHTVMQNYCKTYVLPQDARTLFNMQGNDAVICNNGSAGEMSVVQVCPGSPTSKGKIDYDALQPGDVLFFDMNNKKAIDHCGIYLGNKMFIQSVGTFNQVIITPLTEEKFVNAFVSAARYLPKAENDKDVIAMNMNEEMVVNIDSGKWLKVYTNIDCKSTDENFYKLYRDDRVVLINYCDNISYAGEKSRAYISYEDVEGNTCYGYIMNPMGKLAPFIAE